MVLFGFSVAGSGKKFLISNLLRLILFSIPWLIDQQFPNEVVKPGYVYFALGFCFSSFLFRSRDVLVYHIAFDETSGTIEIHQKTPLGKTEKRFLPFTETRLDIYTKIKKGKRIIYNIDFMNGKRAIASIFSTKGEYTSDSLYQILKTAECFDMETRIA